MIPPPASPGVARLPAAGSALVLAPHPDDEVLGCGGLVALWTRAGAAVRALFLTDGGAGAGSGAERRQLVDRRRAEARAAAKVLRLAGVDFLDLPDGGLDERRDDLESAVVRALLTLRPEVLLVPSPLEASPDHRAAFDAVHSLCSAEDGRPGLAEVLAPLRILAYEVNRPLLPDLLVDVSEVLDEIESAMACHASQQERHDYLGARLGLLRFRTLTLPPGCRGAEAYRTFRPEELRATAPEAVRRELLGPSRRPAGRPSASRISVIVRTRDRPELLAEALASLAASSWRHAEVVLVNDGGAPPRIEPDLGLPLVRVDLETSRGRAGAANAGLDAASGDLVTFLDDDDLVEPDHLETLVGLADAAGVRVAYTDAAVGVWELGSTGWARTERRLPYSRDFDPDRLLVDNYIPFHTLVVERSLALEAAPFDEDLPFFEDWDFLLRLARKTPFHHLARVTCEYRQFRGAGHHVLGDRARERDDFLAVKARVLRKHAAALEAPRLARIVDGLRAETVAAEERARHLVRDLRAVREEGHRHNGRAAAAETRVASLEEQRERLEWEVAGLHERAAALRRDGDELRRVLEEVRAAGEERSRALQAAYDEIARLTALVETMESTRAWRAHRFLERLKG